MHKFRRTSCGCFNTQTRFAMSARLAGIWRWSGQFLSLADRLSTVRRSWPRNRKTAQKNSLPIDQRMSHKCAVITRRHARSIAKRLRSASEQYVSAPS